MTTIATVHTRVENAVGWIVFDNAARLNAMSLAMWGAIPEIVARHQADESVRVIVMTGSGDKAFVSGADISEFDQQRADPEANASYDRTGEHAFASLASLTKPLIARIEGYCIGGGLALALACDIRIASDRSRFAIPAAKLGLGYGFSGVKRLVDVVGPAAAQEILFTARQLSAAEAKRFGLINRVVPAAGLDDAVADLTARCAANAPLTLAAAKLAVRAALASPEARDEASVEAAVRACFESKDYAEGRIAFAEKRKARFRGC